jgi:hypothetical protein
MFIQDLQQRAKHSTCIRIACISVSDNKIRSFSKQSAHKYKGEKAEKGNRECWHVRRDMDVSTRNILPETKNEERLRIDQACTFSSALEV